MLRQRVLSHIADICADTAVSVALAMVLMGGVFAHHLPEPFVRAFALTMPLAATALIGSILCVLSRRIDDRWYLRVVAISWCGLMVGFAANVTLSYVTVLPTLQFHHLTLIMSSILGCVVLIASFLGRALGDSAAARTLGRARFTFLCAVAALIAAYWLERARCFVPFPLFDYSHFVTVLVLCWLTARTARRAGWVRHRATVGCALLCLAGACTAARLPEATSQSAYAAMYRLGGFDRRVLRLLRLLDDRDHDGFSPLFGGGDCDDGNGKAYPLGPTDCDHIRVTAPPAAAPHDLDRHLRPVGRLLLVTIDTLRCEVADEHVCPELERLAAGASYRGSQRVFMARTKASLSALFGLPYVGSPHDIVDERNHLIENSRAMGYRATAFYTLPALGVPALGGSFDEAFANLGDPSLPALEQVTSSRLTDAVLAYLRECPPDQHWIGWAHFLDPHDPYMPEKRSPPLFTFNRRAAYALEMKRTDREVARLIEGALSAGFKRDAAIVVTGDHGENFTHGVTGHGRSSDDIELNVPVAIWLFDERGAQIHLSLPARMFENALAATLASLTGTAPPTGQAAVSLVAPPSGDQQFIIVADNWKYVYHRQARYEELFDLRSDPGEQDDCSQRRPHELARMRQALGRALWSSPGIARR